MVAEGVVDRGEPRSLPQKGIRERRRPAPVAVGHVAGDEDQPGLSHRVQRVVKRTVVQVGDQGEGQPLPEDAPAIRPGESADLTLHFFVLA